MPPITPGLGFGRVPRRRALGRLDVRNALREATAAALQDNGRWCVTGGSALDGEPITLIVHVNRGVVIVTLY